jgi:hypothetical protein
VNCQRCWKPIDTAPKDGTEVLLWNGNVVIGYFENGKQFDSSKNHFCQWTTGREYAGSYDLGYAIIATPTHWMPLPQPPKGKEKQ